MALAISLLRSGLIAITIGVFGTFALQESRSWDAILAYVLALFYLANAEPARGGRAAHLVAAERRAVVQRVSVIVGCFKKFHE